LDLVSNLMDLHETKLATPAQRSIIIKEEIAQKIGK
jgi:hypothetical protein